VSSVTMRTEHLRYSGYLYKLMELSTNQHMNVYFMVWGKTSKRVYY